MEIIRKTIKNIESIEYLEFRIFFQDQMWNFLVSFESNLKNKNNDSNILAYFLSFHYYI